MYNRRYQDSLYCLCCIHFNGGLKLYLRKKAMVVNVASIRTLAFWATNSSTELPKQIKRCKDVISIHIDFLPRIVEMLKFTLTEMRQKLINVTCFHAHVGKQMCHQISCVYNHCVTQTDLQKYIEVTIIYKTMLFVVWWKNFLFVIL